MAVNKKKKCICNKDYVLNQITGNPRPLSVTEINDIRLTLFTERNADGTEFLILRGNDLFQRYHKRIEDSDITALTKYIKTNPKRITKLKLCYNNITDKGFYKLLKRCLVKERSAITHLDIMNNELTDKSIQVLAKYAKLVRLKHLRINGNDIGTKGGEYFAEFLRNNDTVEFCDIGETGQTLTSLAFLFAALRHDQTLKGLHLNRIIPLFNRYQYETKILAYHLEILLENNCTLIELHLQKNELSSHDMEYLVRGLKCNKTLLYLDINYNKIGSYGAELLAKFLETGPPLTLLHLAGNGIQDLGARALSFGLPYSKIRNLNVENNRISDDGILDILNTLKKPFYLRYLYIWGNDIGRKSCEVIERMLLSGVLFQDKLDVRLYEVDEVLYAARYTNIPEDHESYYCLNKYAEVQPILHIKRNR